jgi:hypothetical protein
MTKATVHFIAGLLALGDFARPSHHVHPFGGRFEEAAISGGKLGRKR